MVQEDLTELIGDIVSIDEVEENCFRAERNEGFEIVFVPQGSEGSHISVSYPDYSCKIWNSIYREYMLAENRLSDRQGLTRLPAKIIIKGKIENMQAEYEGVGLIRLLNRVD